MLYELTLRNASKITILLVRCRICRNIETMRCSVIRQNHDFNQEFTTLCIYLMNSVLWVIIFLWLTANRLLHRLRIPSFTMSIEHIITIHEFLVKVLTNEWWWHRLYISTITTPNVLSRLSARARSKSLIIA